MAHLLVLTQVEGAVPQPRQHGVALDALQRLLEELQHGDRPREIPVRYVLLQLRAGFLSPAVLDVQDRRRMEGPKSGQFQNNGNQQARATTRTMALLETPGRRVAFLLHE